MNVKNIFLITFSQIAQTTSKATLKWSCPAGTISLLPVGEE